jgi:DNA-binding CsgD family transcriptional regulator
MKRDTQPFLKNRRSELSAEILTARQREVVGLLSEGRTMREAALILNVSPRTVAFHKYRIMRRQNLKTTADLVRFAIKSHILAS